LTLINKFYETMYEHQPSGRFYSRLPVKQYQHSSHANSWDRNYISVIHRRRVFRFRAWIHLLKLWNFFQVWFGKVRN